MNRSQYGCLCHEQETARRPKTQDKRFRIDNRSEQVEQLVSLLYSISRWRAYDQRDSGEFFEIFHSRLKVTMW